MRSIFLCEGNAVDSVYSEELKEKLAKNAGIDGVKYNSSYVRSHPADFKDVDYIFSTWGMPAFKPEEIKEIFPSLKAVFYGAGSVQGFARGFLNAGVRVFSAWAANAVPVAEYAVSQIILAAKGFFSSSAEIKKTGNYKSGGDISNKYPGNYDISVGILGAGMVGSAVIKLLKNYKLNVMVFDPFLSDERAEELGVTKASLEEIFSKCIVVSNHIADNKETRGMIDGKYFTKMLPQSTFINTGRGAQIVEADLIKHLEERPDCFALLDVTYPEPPAEGSPFYTLPNCILTPHIAGSKGNEVRRMSEYMYEEFQRVEAGEKCKWEVSLKMLETMA